MNHNVQICISNAGHHQLGETLQELKEKGYNIRFERCLQLCAGCKQEPACIVNGVRIVNPHELLREKV